METSVLTSASNEKIKEVQALNSHKKERREKGLFVSEGIRIFKEAPDELIYRVFVSESFYNEHKYELEGEDAFGDCKETPEKSKETPGKNKETPVKSEQIRIPKSAQLYIVKDSIFTRMCDTKTPQGILTVLKMPHYTLDDLCKKEPFIIMLEDVQDPGNVGTIIRTAEGAGATGIVFSAGCADLFSPKTIRSTMGSVFRVPFIFADDMVNMARRLKEKGITLYAAHLKGTCGYDKCDYKGGTAILIGNEGNGLTDELSNEADVLVKIPMEGKLESLNASVAAAILMYAVHSKKTE